MRKMINQNRKCFEFDYLQKVFDEKNFFEREHLIPSMERYPTDRPRSPSCTTGRLRSSGEHNYQGLPFVRYRDPTEIIGGPTETLI